MKGYKVFITQRKHIFLTIQKFILHILQLFAYINLQVFRKALEMNLLGPTRLNQVMLPLIRRAHGRIVYLSSGLCRIASPVRGIHCAILAAIESQANCLRMELRSRGVDVVVVAPGEYTSGNSWLSDEKIREQARDMWRQLHKEQRHAYGEDYFEAAIRSLEKFTKSPVSQTEVILK